MSKNRTDTRKIELVETDNIVHSISRMKDKVTCSDEAIARAFYHAIQMTYCFNQGARQKIREAMNLP